MSGFKPPERCQRCGRADVEVCASDALGGEWACRACHLRLTSRSERKRRNNPRDALETEPLTANVSKGSYVSREGDNVSLDVHDISLEVDRTRARARSLGIDAELGYPFACKLPGHDDHEAVLYPAPEGHWRYRCEAGTRSMAELRASLGYGRPMRTSDPDERARLGEVVVSRWLERLDWEAGLRELRPVPHELPADLSPAGVAVAGGVLLLLALRAERWDGQAFTFSRPHAMAWCDLSEHAARQGLDELRSAGFLVIQGRQRLAYLYRLGEPQGEVFW